MRQKRETTGSVDPDGWMTTFADMLMLLLTFFVLMLSMRTLSMDQMQETFGFFIRETPQTVSSDEKLSGALTLRLTREVAKLPAGIREKISVVRENGVTRIRLQSDGLFASGSATIREDGAPFLDAISGLLAPLPVPVAVVGHTDSRLFRNKKNGNGELSILRSFAVRQYLVGKSGMDAGLLAVGGAGASKLLYGETDRNRRAWNRRVSFVLLDGSDG